MTAIADKVRAIIGELSGTDDFADDTPLGGAPFEQRGLCLESLDRIELVIALEEAFNIDIPDSDFTSAEMGTPGGIVAYLEQRMAA